MQKIIISHASDAGQRIDRFCKKYLPNAALGGIYKMLRTWKIKVNGKKKDQTYKLEPDDEITFWISDDELLILKKDEVPPSSMIEISSPAPQLSILYEDEYLMVLAKPAGLNVHAGDHKTNESNLIDQVQDYLQGRHDSLTFRPALVHRIDRDTSGCILIAKEKNVLESLLLDLQSHKIEKIYHTLVFGIPQKPQDTVRAKLLRVENARDEAKVRVDETGQTAVTHYRIIKSYPVLPISSGTGGINPSRLPREAGQETESGISLLECRIETGRTHQIRVHMAYIGCPIIGDKAYGDKKLNSYVARNMSIHRQMLHARELIFVHPITKKRLHIEAPYPTDFLSLISH